jgi:hypothetical protein
MVVAVFGGTRSSEMSRLHITSVARENGRLLIRYREECPVGPDNYDESAPFHIIVTARQTGPEQFVEMHPPAAITWARADLAAVLPIRFRTIDRGDDSLLTVRRELVVRTVGAWDLVWHRHRGTARPDIDFSREMVIAVFGGGQGQSSAVEIVEVALEDGETVVRYVEHREAALPLGRAAFHLIAIPARRAPVRFVRQPD